MCSTSILLKSVITLFFHGAFSVNTGLMAFVGSNAYAIFAVTCSLLHPKAKATRWLATALANAASWRSCLTFVRF